MHWGGAGGSLARGGVQLPAPTIIYWALLAFAVFNVSTASILFRLAGVHGFVAATWRLLISAALTIAILAAFTAIGKHRRPIMPGRRDLAFMAASGIALALHFDLWLLSLLHLNVAPSVVIVDSYPALVALAGWTIFKERYTSSQILGATIAMGGVAVLALYSGSEGLAPPGGDPVIGALLAFAGMIAVAAYFTLGKHLRGRYTTLEYTSIVYLTAALASLMFTKTLSQPLTGYTLETYTYLAFMALLPMLGGHTVVNFLLGRISLLASTIPLLGEPVGASILAWIILGEKLDAISAALMFAVIAGIALVLLGEEKRRRAPGGAG